MKKVLVGGVGAGLLSAGGLWVGLVPLVIRAMTPDVPFADQPPPPPPDDDLAAAWSALPGRVDAADVAPAELPAGDQATAPADVFYVHPTSYVGSDWNAPFDDPNLQRDSDAGGARIQAAFRSFLARRGGDRPFLVAAHSQGSVLAERLLAEEIAGTPLRDRLVAAWLPGATVLAEGIAPDLLPCRDADDLHCVIAWNARRPDWVEAEIVVVPRWEGELLCTNPLTWTTDATLAPASSNRGAVFLDAADSSPRAGFASARCAGGTLLVDEVGRAPRDLMSRILDHVLGKGNLHPIEYQLYWANLRENAAVRVAAATAR